MRTIRLTLILHARRGGNRNKFAAEQLHPDRLLLGVPFPATDIFIRGWLRTY
jgi:hypothetical protein